MKDIMVGIIILIAGFFIIDFIYTEKNTCDVSKSSYSNETAKCGLLKKQFDLDVNVFGRYW